MMIANILGMNSFQSRTQTRRSLSKLTQSRPEKNTYVKLRQKSLSKNVLFARIFSLELCPYDIMIYKEDEKAVVRFFTSLTDTPRSVSKLIIRSLWYLDLNSVSIKSVTVTIITIIIVTTIIVLIKISPEDVIRLCSC